LEYGQVKPGHTFLRNGMTKFSLTTQTALAAKWEEKIVVLFAWLINHQPAVLYSQNKPATSNQPAILFSHNKPAPVISHQPNEETVNREKC
jgi:hypothetical protein